MEVLANSLMPRRSINAPMSAGCRYIEATWRSRGIGRSEGGSPPSCSMTPTRERSAGLAP